QQGQDVVQRGKQQEDERDAEGEAVNRVVTGELLLSRVLGQLGREARGQDLFGESFNGCQRVATARPRRGLAAEVGGGEHVVARDFVGTAHFLHGRNGTERNNPTRIISRFKQANVVGAQAKLRIGLSGDTISAADKREVVYV